MTILEDLKNYMLINRNLNLDQVKKIIMIMFPHLTFTDQNILNAYLKMKAKENKQ